VTDLDARLGGLRTAVDTAARFISPELAAETTDLLAKAAQRSAAGSELTAVALAGSTGSGKSSLFNALTELELASTGVKRPTTLTTTACVYGDVDATQLLDWLGIVATRRLSHGSPLDERRDDEPGLVLLDLPDHDSVVTAHRDEVERLTARADVLVWVTDPVKYADALLHLNYLRRLTHHDAVVIVVLNQADQLAPDEVEACTADLSRLLDDDGVGGSVVLATSAATGQGVDVLRERLVAAAFEKQAAADRLGADAAALAERIGAELDLGTERRGGEPSDHPDQMVLTHLRLERREQALDRRRRREAETALRWPLPGAGAESLALDQSTTASSEEKSNLETSVADHVEACVHALPAPWRPEARAAVPVSRLVDDWWQTADSLDRRTDEYPKRWRTLRAVQWAVLGVGAASALALVVLVVLVMAGQTVEPAAWLLPAVGGLAAVGGVVLVNRNRSRMVDEWSHGGASSAREQVEAQVRQSVQSGLVEPLAAARRDAAQVSDALDAALV
jgi:GTP-binding protein EngB required for normal cell division